MAPRSSAKKEPPAVWTLCDGCSLHIASKDRDQHSAQCPAADRESAHANFAHVRDRRVMQATVVSGQLPPDTPLLLGSSPLPDAQLDGFVFVSEATMTLCGWILGDLLELRSAEATTVELRAVWPVPDRHGTTVFVTKSELRNTWTGADDLRLSLRKHDAFVAPAAHIVVRPMPAANEPETEIDAAAWRELRTVLGRLFYNRSVCVGSRLTVEFLNKTFRFRVVDVTPPGDETAGRTDELSERLEALQLDAGERSVRFCTISERRTQFVLDESRPDAPADAIGRPIDLLGGLDATVRQLRDIAALAFGRMPRLHGVQVSRAVLVHGLPGCGKTLLCDALAAESGALVVRLNASDVFSKYFGETEANLRAHFERAFANHPRPTVLIVEEIVNVCAKDAKEDSAKRVTAAFLNALDAVHTRPEGSRVLVLATTANVELVNAAARRCGRLDVELEIAVPNPDARADILQRHVARVRNALRPEDVRALADQCHGFVGSDLASLVAKAALHASNAAAGDTGELTLRLVDLQQVFGLVKPSAMREVLIECPNVRWDDIGGQAELKLQLKQAIEWPLTHPERFTRLGIAPPRGILMFGPPGCSKTMIAKALATESRVNFLSIKGPELFSMWVGESEKAVRDLFRKARSVAPAIIFFDEIDAIGGERGAGAGTSVKERVLAQLLTEMDGVNALQNVTIVAATNRPDLIDTALMRPGRIDRIVYVRLPDAATREEIFRIKMRQMPVGDDVDVTELVRETDGYSGAEVQAVCQEAALKALEDDFDAIDVRRKDFVRALSLVQRRTSADLLRLYEEYLRNF